MGKREKYKNLQFDAKGMHIRINIIHKALTLTNYLKVIKINKKLMKKETSTLTIQRYRTTIKL